MFFGIEAAPCEGAWELSQEPCFPVPLFPVIALDRRTSRSFVFGGKDGRWPRGCHRSCRGQGDASRRRSVSPSRRPRGRATARFGALRRNGTSKSLLFWFVSLQRTGSKALSIRFRAGSTLGARLGSRDLGCALWAFPAWDSRRQNQAATLDLGYKSRAILSGRPTRTIGKFPGVNFRA